MSNKELAAAYFYSAEWDSEDRLYVATVAEWPSVAAHGKTESSAIEEAKAVVEECLGYLAEELQVPPMPLSLKVK